MGRAFACAYSAVEAWASWATDGADPVATGVDPVATGAVPAATGGVPWATGGGAAATGVVREAALREQLLTAPVLYRAWN